MQVAVLADLKQTGTALAATDCRLPLETTMPRSILAVLALAASVGIGGCASQSKAEKVGTVGGAVAGGAIGNAAGGGPLGTLGGAAAGGYLGDKAGEAYDRKH